MKRLTNAILTSLLLMSCGKEEKSADAYGNFEATEVIISAEANGKLLDFKISNGQNLKIGDYVGVIDTVQLSLRRQQLMAQQQSIKSRFKNIVSQADVYKEQVKALIIEKKRTEKLIADSAVPSRQLDDINGKINVTQSQINSINTQHEPVFTEVESSHKQILQIQDQINKSYLINPINGTVLETYIEPNEMAGIGKPLYKIADLSNMDLKVYVDGAQLANIRLSQKVKVFVDKDKKANRELEGKIIWISPQAEFTPKIIQTKKERVNLVYAVKVRVINDGTLKISMPGEVFF